jgi:hypothetical protein
MLAEGRWGPRSRPHPADAPGNRLPSRHRRDMTSMSKTEVTGQHSSILMIIKKANSPG